VYCFRLFAKKVFILVVVMVDAKKGQKDKGQGHDNMKQQHGRAGVGCRLRCAAEPSTDSERIHDHEYLLLSSLSIKKETRLLLYTGN